MHESDQVARAESNLFFSSHDASEVQHFVDHHQQLVCIAVDEVKLMERCRVVVLLHHALYGRNDESQWSAQLVADIGEEDHLGLFDLFLLLEFHFLQLIRSA